MSLEWRRGAISEIASLPGAVGVDSLCDPEKDAGYFYKENTSKGPQTDFFFKGKLMTTYNWYLNCAV